MSSDIKLNDFSVSYLEMVQNVVDRMSNISVTVKGFAATIVAGVLAITISGTAVQRIIVISMSLVLVIMLGLVDCKYLAQEKRYRGLYKDICLGRHECDFDLNLDPKDKSCWGVCLRSFSILPFYGVLIVVLVISIVLSCRGVL